MGSFFRSEEMELYCLLIPRENAYNFVSQLGEKDLFHFIDAEPHIPQFNRLYSKQTKRCEELLKKVDEIGNIMTKFGYDHGLGKGDVTNFLNLLEMKKKSRKQDEQYYIDELEKEIDTVLKDMKKQIVAANEIRQNMNLMVEQRACLEKIVPLIGGDQQISSFSSLASGEDSQSRIGKIIGSINMIDSMRFQKFMFRASKGKCFILVQPIETSGTKYKIVDPATSSEEINKGVFLFIYNQSQLMEAKLQRICKAIGANIFQFENDIENLQDDLKSNSENYQKSRELLTLTYKHLEQLFNRLQNQTEEITLLEQYRLTLCREKQIYHHINLTKNTGAVLKAYIWLPKSQEESIMEYLQTSQDLRYATAQLHPVSGNDYQRLTNENKRPSKIQKNEFLDVFQEIVNTYGVPRYREINPGLFSIITFPFLFGVMFGDIGHGSLLFLFGCYLMFSYDQKRDQYDQLYKCRYIISLMGFFAVFCGFIYNDFMSIPLDLFGSCYNKSTKKTLRKSDEDCVYPFGIDPAWLNATNSLQYYNSFKMKTAIIFGILQMVLGILLKGLNSLFKLSAVDFFFEFIPQLFFLVCTFGYMVLLIILKWLSSYDSPRDAPSILNIMLNFPLKMGQLDPKYEPILGYIDVSRENQEYLQYTLLIVAIICIPFMLFPKPIIQYYYGKKEEEQHSPEMLEIQDSQISEIQEQHQSLVIKDKKQQKQIDKQEHHEDFSELFVHQIIESIEFVLGSISHTASYLRLWALSLAHSQLAGVFFEKTLLKPIEEHSVIGLVVGFFVFALITFAVLMCMDVMECFLHTLRLHWVEFQSKFYKADGVLFMPLSFKQSLSSEKYEREN